MVFSICCLALSGGTLAADYFSFVDSPSDVSTYGIVVDKSCGISWNDMSWSSSFGSGSLTSGASWLSASESGGYQHLYLGRQIDLPIGHGSGIVNISPGTVKLSDGRWENGLSQIRGQIRFGLQLRDNGNSPTGASSYISPFKLKAEINVDGDNKIVESRGGTLNIDLSFPAESEIRGMNLYAYFNDNHSIQIEPYNGAMFLWAQISSTVRTYKGDANAQYQDDVVSGINEGNGLLSGILGAVTDLWDAISSLPGKIADAIKGLFVPTDAQMDELKASFNALLSEKLGFVYQAGSLVDDVFKGVKEAVSGASPGTYTIPPAPSFEVSGVEVQLWDDDLEVDFASNEYVQTAQEMAYPFVIAILVYGFVHSMHDAFLFFLDGGSLYGWIVSSRNAEPLETGYWTDDTWDDKSGKWHSGSWKKKHHN